MKLIGGSIGVLMVSGAILAIAPASSLAQSAMFRRPGLPGITLTSEQAQRLDQLEAQTQSELQTILTQSQLTQLEAVLQAADGISRTAITALNLSSTQQVELMHILLSTQQQADAVLTPGQVEIVRRNLPFHP